MAEMIAGKIFPDIGQYSCAGVNPADSLDANMVSFMQERGYNLSAISPQQLDSSRESLAEYHVIVGLHKKVLKTIVKIPFRTSALNWKDVDVPDSDDPQAWESLHKTLALHIRELLTLLRGDEAV
jgi:protein-tyrosine-phosphatase